MRRTIVPLALVACLLPAPTSRAAAFRGLGDLPGSNYSRAMAVSPDGSVVVGYGHPSGREEAFRWTAGAGMAGLGRGPNNSTASQAHGVSQDGSAIAGIYFPATFGGGSFYWTATGGINGFEHESRVYGLSGNGLYLVGDGPSRWRVLPDGTIASQDLRPNLSYSGTAFGASADGSVVVGQADRPSGTFPFAFRWTQSSGMVDLRSPGDAFLITGAYDVSPDGRWVTGYADDQRAGAFVPFRWSSDTGMVGLGRLPLMNIHEGLAISAGGSVVVGRASPSASPSDPPYRAIIWDEAGGLRLLQDELIGLGVDLNGWTLWEATDISDDGLTIVGAGRNPQGGVEAWIATIPEPAALLLLVLTSSVFCARRPR